jgi:hypothetical protein
VKDDRELVLAVQMGSLKKEYALPLEKTTIAKEEQLAEDNKYLTERVDKLTKELVEKDRHI